MNGGVGGRDKSEDKELIIRPNTRCFNAVIAAFAKRGDAERAEEILRSMLTTPNNGKNNSGNNNHYTQHEYNEQQVHPDTVFQFRH